MNPEAKPLATWVEMPSTSVSRVGREAKASISSWLS
jgi:hypothetical protein